MASIWMSLERVPVDKFVSLVVVPMIRALGDHGIHANLKPVSDRIFRNEGDLTLALFPGGRLAFFYTTGSTADFPFRQMMASVSDIPHGLELDEAAVIGAIQQFQSEMIEKGMYDGRAQVTEGGSFAGVLDCVEITN